jgi:hypothetical protein
MPATEAQKRAMKKWREEHPEYARKYYKDNKEKLDDASRLNKLKRKSSQDIEKLKAELAHKQHLIDMYEASRAQDSPITTDEDSD